MRTKRLQVVFVVLLLVCVVQVVWWIFDQARLSQRWMEQTIEAHDREREAANRWIRRGFAPIQLEGLYPALTWDAHAKFFVVDPIRLASVAEERRMHMWRYGWEGSFFLLVLLSGLGVIASALRQNAELLRRQQNFLAAVSHEFKSPVASLRLSVETLWLRDPEAAKRRELLQRMLADVERFESTVMNILAVARMGQAQAEE